MRKRENESEKSLPVIQEYGKKEGRAEAAKKSPHFVIKPRNSSIDFGGRNLSRLARVNFSNFSCIDFHHRAKEGEKK